MDDSDSSGLSGFLWYELGRSSAHEDEMHQRTLDAVRGRRPIQVDQTYLDNLHASLHHARVDANANYSAYADWKAHATRLQDELEDAKAVIAELDRHIGQADRWTAELEARLQIKERNLHYYSDMVQVLSKAEKAGKRDTSEYRELRQLLEDMDPFISRGERIPGYTGEKYQHYLFLVRTLNPR
jgi:DNA repair exonuclease SbcCD ATPase subunit